MYDNGKEKEYFYSLYQLHNVASKYSRSYDKQYHNQRKYIEKERRACKYYLVTFCPYRIQDDLMLNNSYWNRYIMALDNNMISVKGLEVCQNIQDVCHNLTELKAAKDDLLKSTTYVAHELDKNHHSHANDETTISFNEIADIFAQQDNYGVRQVHPTKRSLSTIASRCNIITQDIPLDVENS